MVDTEAGRVDEWPRFEHMLDDIYDAAVLPGVRQANAVGFMGEEIKRTVSVG